MPDIIHPCSPEIAAKVAYEIRMFRHDYEKLAQLQVDTRNILPGDVMPRVGTGISTEEVRDASAFVESFLLHARVLRDFFCRERLKPDDVIASDFVAEWARPPASDYSYITAQKDRLDKALAHLTTTRVRYDSEGKLWDVVTMRREMEPMIGRFLAKLPDDRKPWFKDAWPPTIGQEMRDGR
jgi:hypothetical protein